VPALTPAPSSFCFEALRARSFASRRPKRYLTCIRRDGGRTHSLKTYFLFRRLVVRTLCFAAARTQPQNTSKAEPTIKLARSQPTQAGAE